MKRLLLLFLAVTLAIGFAYVTTADADCGMMGGGCGAHGQASMKGCGMGAMTGSCGAGCMCGEMHGAGHGCGMAGTEAMKGSCGIPGCGCGAGCSGAGCACEAMRGMGGHAARHGMGNPMMKAFLDETKDLRKELHMKKFEYHEAARNFDVPVEDLMKMEKEIKMLQMKIERYWLK